MKVLMLGWEYPPHISGGLGTACEGLTRALVNLDVQIKFVVPHLHGDENPTHMTIVAPNDGIERDYFDLQTGNHIIGQPYLSMQRIAAFLKPYWSEEIYINELAKHQTRSESARKISFEEKQVTRLMDKKSENQSQHYGRNIFGEVERFADRVISAVGPDRSFDLIHAHDWMTYPAGVALAALSGKPLVVHVHSLEYDRSGVHVNEKIDRIERLGVSEATKVIAVSHYTKSIIEKRHGIASEKVHVVHNGVYSQSTKRNYERTSDWPAKSVLFLGRVTFQKGPDYFVEAAAKVIPHVPDACFILAGTGDMLSRIEQRVKELGLTENFRFPGFVRGAELEKMLSLADIYVMPSVSEPFGISALEAISYDTPAIISRQSGVSEVLDHALKVDFWDIDRMADLIINGLLHEELREDMAAMAHQEVKRLRWDASARKTHSLYSQLVC